MLFYEKTEHVCPTAFWHGMLLLLIAMQERSQGIQEGIQRVLLISSHLVQEVVEAFDSQVVFVFVANRQKRTDRCPVLLQLVGNNRHVFQAPRSYSWWVSTWRM